jgi:hypothetical protein
MSTLKTDSLEEAAAALAESDDSEVVYRGVRITREEAVSKVGVEGKISRSAAMRLLRASRAAAAEEEGFSQAMETDDETTP